MSTTDPNSVPSVADRLERIESLLMHMQYEVEQLDRALQEQQSRLSSIEHGLALLREHMDTPPESPRDPRAEKPPHY